MFSHYSPVAFSQRCGKLLSTLASSTVAFAKSKEKINVERRVCEGAYLALDVYIACIIWLSLISPIIAYVRRAACRNIHSCAETRLIDASGTVISLVFLALMLLQLQRDFANSHISHAITLLAPTPVDTAAVMRLILEL